MPDMIIQCLVRRYDNNENDNYEQVPNYLDILVSHYLTHERVLWGSYIDSFYFAHIFPFFVHMYFVCVFVGRLVVFLIIPYKNKIKKCFHEKYSFVHYISCSCFIFFLSSDIVACASADACMAACGNPRGCTNMAFPSLVLGVMPNGRSFVIGNVFL